MSDSSPPQGQMVLYSSATPPLDDGSYRITVATDVSYHSGDLTTDTPPDPLTSQHYFDVVGPRFSLPPGMVAGCFPPRNSHGAFQDSLPHIVLSRRTLPWEREIALASQIPATPLRPDDPPALADPCPWVALLVFEEGEYTLLSGIPLEKVVPADVFAALGKPDGILCDAVEAELALIKAIMPSFEELRLLVHVRQVNTDDRELNAYGGDGYFSVVVASRLPSPKAECRAVLVSLEQRLDLIPNDQDLAVAAPPPPAATEAPGFAPQVDLVAKADPGAAPGSREKVAAAVFSLSRAPAHATGTGESAIIGLPQPQAVRLVALASWKFTCEGPGTFRELMQNLDDSMFGNVPQPGQPPITDTGHIFLPLQDRAGETEQVLYRGPLVQYQLTRDPLGPYHSADQARRVSPEAASEDISYSAAFELGRLLAAADPRMAQALLRWRRESCKQSARVSTIGALAERVPLGLPAAVADQLHTPLVARAAVAAAEAVAGAHLPPGDPFGLNRVATAPGLNPAQLATAWQITEPAATALLGGDPGSLGTPVTPPAQTPRSAISIDQAATDAAGLDRLTAARAQAIANATKILGG